MKLKKFFSSNIREISLIIVMIALSVFIEIRSGGNFFTLENISDMFTETAFLAITAAGMMIVIITSGIDLSIGSIMALGAMVGGTILKNNQAVPGVVIILVSIAVGIVCGFINGTLVAKLKILPIIATLGMMNIYRGLTYLVANGSWVKQQEMGTKFLSIATGKFLGINNLIVIAIVVYIIAAFFLNKTRTGRKIYAVGNSEESILYVCKYGVAQGETCTGYEMNVIAACVLGGVSINGGTGRVQGVLLGAVLLGILNNAMPLIHVSSFWQEAIRGLIILLSIIANSLIQRNVEMKALRRRNI